MTWRRILRIGFVVIACLSLLLNAVVIGAGLRLADRGLPGGGIGQALIQMPREVRRSYVSGLKAEQPELRRLAENLRDRRQEMLSAAIADPVDPAALEAAMAAVREATAAMQSAAHAAMLKTVAEPSASEP